MFAYYARWIRNFSGKIKPLTDRKLNFPLQSDAVAAFENLLFFEFENLREKLLSARAPEMYC